MPPCHHHAACSTARWAGWQAPGNKEPICRVQEIISDQEQDVTCVQGLGGEEEGLWVCVGGLDGGKARLANSYREELKSNKCFLLISALYHSPNMFSIFLQQHGKK